MTRHRRRRHLARAPIGLTAGVAAFAGWPRGSEAPLPPHPPDAFARAPATTLVQPFAIGIDPMARLLLVNIDGDPDDVYLGFEPQAFDDEVHGRGLIVVAWRRDGRVDVYHQPSVTLDPATYDIAGAGLHAMLERPFDGAWFEIRESGVDADLRFHDADGRRVELTVRELGTRPRPRFGLLAPMGDAATSPSALPLVLLRDFSFVRRTASEVRVAIDGREHRIDALPVPIDRQAATFVRYAQAPLIARLNPAHDGAATLLDGAASGVRTLAETIGETRLAVVRSETHTAIERLERRAGDQTVQIALDPPFANPLDLADDLRLERPPRPRRRGRPEHGVELGARHALSAQASTGLTALRRVDGRDRARRLRYDRAGSFDHDGVTAHPVLHFTRACFMMLLSASRARRRPRASAR